MRFALAATVAVCLAASLVFSQVAAPPVGPASRPAVPATPATASANPEANDFYNKVQSAYLKGRWTEFAELQKTLPKFNALLAQAQRDNVVYMRQTAGEFRPAWWKSCRSTSNISFQANIWGRGFVANYMPTDELGGQQAVGVKDGKIQVIVTWRPNFVDNPKEAEGELAKKFEITKGDLGEVIVWHELGHNYITSFLPLPQVIELYNDHFKLFDTLQEFYADLTSLYHCSPKGRLVTMMIRLDDVSSGRELEGHARASYAIGSLILAEVLGNPSKWPSFHFPPKVPEKDVERNAVVYLYENIDPNWTLAEDKALRDMISKFIRAQGEQVLRGRGEVKLPNRLTFRLMEPDDREHVQKRDAWVKGQLEKAITDGRADKPAPASRPTRFPLAEKRLLVPWDN